MSRIMMTEACRDALRALAHNNPAVETGHARLLTVMNFLDSVEILPNPEPAPAEAVEALRRADSMGSMLAGMVEGNQGLTADAAWCKQAFSILSDQAQAIEQARAALARLAELEKRQPSEEQVRAAWEAVRALRDEGPPLMLLTSLDRPRKGDAIDQWRCQQFEHIAAALPTPADAEEKR